MAVETEVKDYSWVCSTLVSCGSILPVHETIFLHKDEVTLWVAPSPQGSIQRISFQDEGVLSIADALSTLKSRHDRDNQPSSTLCWATVKGVRVAVDAEKVTEWSYPRGSLGRCSALQPPIERMEATAFYVLRLEEKNGGFDSSFSQRRRGILHTATNARLYYKLLIYSKIVIAAILSLKRRKVATLELEFLVSDSGNIWIIGAGECTLYPVTGVKTVPTTPKPSKSAEPQLKTKRDLVPITAFRVSTPEQLHQETESSTMTASENQQSPVPMETGEAKAAPAPTVNAIKDQLPLIITSPVPLSIRSPRISPYHSALFSNPYFKEIITRTYAKTHRKFTSNLEEVFRDMEANYLAYDEPLPSPGFSTRMRHSSSNVFIHEPSPPLFEIQAASKPKELEIPPIPQTVKRNTPLPTFRRLVKKTPMQMSQGTSSIQKILEKYKQSPKKQSERCRSIPGRVYYFKQL